MPFMRVDREILRLYILFEKSDIREFVCLCDFLFADFDLYLLREEIGFFLYLLNGKLCKCRSPPFINLFLKKFKLIGGKKDGRTPKKKKI